MKGERLIVALVLGLGVSSLAANELAFEERVEAQRAIDRIYYSHQLGATRPFDEAVPQEVTERKVATYLKESVALDTLWHTPVTQAMLQRELERVARETRSKERLEEIYAALGNDPFLIAECLARPILADRMARRFYAWDQGIHHAARAEAEELRAGLATFAAAFANDARRTERWVVKAEIEAETPEDDTTAVIRLPSEEFARWRSSMPALVGVVGPVQEERDAFVLELILEETPIRVRVARYEIKKRAWDDWWEEASRGVSIGVAKTGSTTVDAFAAPGGWNPTGDATEAAPEFRTNHTAVWTGTHMLVWGGENFFRLNTGGSYDPATDSWTEISTLNAPVARARHTAVWTGSVMVIWGGSSDTSENTGGRYEPITNTWAATATLDAPSGRVWQTAVWTGSKMIVWGGAADAGPFDTGGQYDPEADKWTPMTTAGAPVARYRHVGVWTGSRMIVWGGWDSSFSELSTGGEYDPNLDRWKSTSTRNAPQGRLNATAVWTGAEMVVWGGSGLNKFLRTGGRYDPLARAWTRTAMTGAPPNRSGHTAVWSGQEMIVWGGVRGAGTYPLSSGGRYYPLTDTWTQTSTVDAPSGREGHTAVWTGSRMIVWGGSPKSVGTNTGGQYDPNADAWMPTSTGPAQGE